MNQTTTKPCGNPKCCSSTGICERTTHGHGLLDSLGYWQHPCFVCARHFEEVFKEAQWPHPTEDKNHMADQIEQRECLKCHKPFDCFKDDGYTKHCDECYTEDDDLPPNFED